MFEMFSLCQLFGLLLKNYPLGYMNNGSPILSVLDEVRVFLQAENK